LLGEHEPGQSAAGRSRASDRQIDAVVAIESPGDGERWLRSQRPHWKWLDFQGRLAQDRSQRVRTGQSARVDPHL